jgi:arabinogalactan endo-1,4-beta-galactosidase
MGLGGYATHRLLRAGVGSPNVNLTLFDFQGAALPSIGIFGNPAAICASYDPWNTPCIIGG